MIKEVDEVIRHAVMAAHDREIRSIAIVMIANGDPEVHITVCDTDAYVMSTAADMFKGEMMKLLNVRAENRKRRE